MLPPRSRVLTAIVIAAIALSVSSTGTARAHTFLLSDAITGGETTYTIRRGDTLTLIGARFGVSPSVLAETNGFKLSATIRPGQILKVYNTHIVPRALSDGIVINAPQRMLFLFRSGELVSAYPVAVGRPSWRTPTHEFKVIRLDENPTWVVPPSIQREMAADGEPVESVVPPGPDNPLGQYRIVLNIPGYAIHGTNAPSSIYTFQTHGCIRLYPSNAEAFFKQVSVGMRGEIIYDPVQMARLAGGRIFVEVDPDIYHRNVDPLAVLHRLADSNKLANMIDWPLVQKVAKHREGVARDVSLSTRTAGEVRDE